MQPGSWIIVQIVIHLCLHQYCFVVESSQRSQSAVVQSSSFFTRLGGSNWTDTHCTGGLSSNTDRTGQSCNMSIEGIVRASRLGKAWVKASKKHPRFSPKPPRDSLTSYFGILRRVNDSSWRLRRPPLHPRFESPKPCTSSGMAPVAPTKPRSKSADPNQVRMLRRAENAESRILNEILEIQTQTDLRIGSLLEQQRDHAQSLDSIFRRADCFRRAGIQQVERFLPELHSIPLTTMNSTNIDDSVD